MGMLLHHLEMFSLLNLYHIYVIIALSCITVLEILERIIICLFYFVSFS